MNKVIGILLIIPCIFLIFMYMASYSILDADYNEFEEYRLEKINNYATDAAVQELLLADDLDQNYENTDMVTINPDMARDAFLSVLAISYDMNITQDLMKTLSAQYLDMFIVCAYDGYYVYTKDGLSRAGSDKVDYSSYSYIKYPYVYEHKDAAGNIDARYAFSMDYDHIMYKLTEHGIDAIDPDDVTVDFSKEQALSIINTTINREVNHRLEEMAANGSLGSVMIPAAATKVGTVNNNIENVSVLAFVNNINFTTSKRLNSFSLGGAKIKEVRQIACYVRGGKKYYAFVDKVPEVYNGYYYPRKDLNDINSWAIHVVNTQEEAARLGYTYDMEFMERR